MACSFKFWKRYTLSCTAVKRVLQLSYLSNIFPLSLLVQKELFLNYSASRLKSPVSPYIPCSLMSCNIKGLSLQQDDIWMTQQFMLRCLSPTKKKKKSRAQNHSCAKWPLWLWYAAGWCKTGLSSPSNENTFPYTGCSPFHDALFHVHRAPLDQQTSCSCSGNFTASVHLPSVFRLLVLDLLLCSHMLKSQQDTWTKTYIC